MTQVLILFATDLDRPGRVVRDAGVGHIVQLGAVDVGPGDSHRLGPGVQGQLVRSRGPVA